MGLIVLAGEAAGRLRAAGLTYREVGRTAGSPPATSGRWPP